MLETDLHVHTLFSDDAFNTVWEMIEEAEKKGVKMVAICDHGPAALGVSVDDPFHFSATRRRKRLKVGSVELVWGIEIDILDESGTLDPAIPQEVLEKQHLVIASLHRPKDLKPGMMQESINPAKAIVEAMRNPLVDVIGHPFLRSSNSDIEPIVEAAVEHKVALALNNSYLKQPLYSKDVYQRAVKMVKLLGKTEGKIFVGSDAHIAWELGGDEGIKSVLKEAGFGTKNVVNWTLKQASQFLAHRRRDA